MKKILLSMILSVGSLFLTSCGGGSDSSDSSNQDVLEERVFESVDVKVPTLVVIMNWSDYSENDPTIWANKIFNYDENSVNRWYYDSTNGNIELVPVLEENGVTNDGVITVNMGKAHPGGYNDTTFRDVEIANAITSDSVNGSVDFASYDTDGDGTLNFRELQIIFIVAGGEEAYGDSASHSIWAHSWAFDSNNAPVVDGVSVMRYSGSIATSGVYARFGAIHGIDDADAHKAVIGIIAHELGHSLFDLYDLYDLGGGSGIGSYDIMSSGSWAKKTTDSYMGDTPTQFSAFSKIDTGLENNITTVTATTTVEINCSSNSLVKVPTAYDNEYFLLECRDTAHIDSDRSFNYFDSSFTDNKLFGVAYHVDSDKTTNHESGTQTTSNHYMVSVIEKDRTVLMTSREGIEADYKDVYSVGDSYTLETYDGSQSFDVVVEAIDDTSRTMRLKISK